MLPCLLLSIIRYESRVSGVIQGKEYHPPLHLTVVTIEKGAVEKGKFVFWFGAQFNSTLDFTQSG